MGKADKGGDSTSQSERFKRTARELGVELNENKLREALRRMGKQRDAREEDAESDRDSED